MSRRTYNRKGLNFEGNIVFEEKNSTNKVDRSKALFKSYFECNWFFCKECAAHRTCKFLILLCYRVNTKVRKFEKIGSESFDKMCEHRTPRIGVGTVNISELIESKFCNKTKKSHLCSFWISFLEERHSRVEISTIHPAGGVCRFVGVGGTSTNKGI